MITDLAPDSPSTFLETPPSKAHKDAKNFLKLVWFSQEKKTLEGNLTYGQRETDFSARENTERWIQNLCVCVFFVQLIRSSRLLQQQDWPLVCLEDSKQTCTCLCVSISGQYRGTKTGECVDLGASRFTFTHTHTHEHDIKYEVTAAAMLLLWNPSEDGNPSPFNRSQPLWSILRGEVHAMTSVLYSCLASVVPGYRCASRWPCCTTCVQGDVLVF